MAEDRNGVTAKLASVVRLGTPKPVYNLTVDGAHTDFVRAGSDHLWVHNSGNCDPPEIKAGSSGGPTARGHFSKAVKDQAHAENPGTCVYCRMKTGDPEVDHVIARTRGGNATIDNAQIACRHCNASKGNNGYPLNKPPGFQGGWPPHWW